jgi:hypothetical protein
MTRRKFMLIAVVVALMAAALGWWVDSRAKPQVRFIGFQGAGTDRVAVFEVVNRSARTIYFRQNVVARGGSADVKVPGAWRQRDAGSGLPFVAPSGEPIDPKTRAEFSVPVSKLPGTPSAPFRIGIEYPQPAPKFLRYPPFSWLPAAVRATRLKLAWSETVAP